MNLGLKLSQEPLGLPRGSVRAIITLVLLGVTCVLAFVPGDPTVTGMFVLLTGIAVRDYFGHRAIRNEEDGPAVPPSYVRED